MIIGASVVLTWAVEGFYARVTGERVSAWKLIAPEVFVIGVVLVVIAGAIWRRAWRRWPWLERQIFPDLNGIWVGNLVSTAQHPATGEAPNTISAAVTITQGLFSTSVKLRTDELTSYSTRCLLEAFPHAGRFRIWYSYDNAPRAQLRQRSCRHEGVAWLEVDHDADQNRLVGMYFTERGTRGDIDLRRQEGSAE